MSKSSKQRRAEIRAARMRRARRLAERVEGEPEYFPWSDKADPDALPDGAVPADPQALSHNNTYGPIPRFYVDKAFHCADCGREDLWTAKQQKWWYEIAKGDINTTAKYCRPCRQARRAETDRKRAVHFSGLVARHGLRDAARRLKKPAEEVSRFIADHAEGAANDNG